MKPAQVIDPDVRILAAHSATLREDYTAQVSPWAGSPFEWILGVPSGSRGAVGCKLVSGWLATKGFDVARSPDSGADRLVNGVRTEIKFSTLWKAGVYKFQQIRDQDYKIIICLGVSPFDAHCWVLEKSALFKARNRQPGFIGQHAGSQGKDTAWLTLNAAHPHEWLAAHGGRLSQAASIIAQITGRPPV